jgi:hypothetical protein
MAEAVLDGVCVPVSGEEDNYLDFFGKTAGEESILGVCGLMRMAGAVSTDWSEATAFDMALLAEPDEYGSSFWKKQREEYQQREGRKFPPLYRVKIKVEVEQVPDEEAEKLWHERAKLYERLENEEE